MQMTGRDTKRRLGFDSSSEGAYLGLVRTQR
jgi:hypothetical protein